MEAAGEQVERRETSYQVNAWTPIVLNCGMFGRVQLQAARLTAAGPQPAVGLEHRVASRYVQMAHLREQLSGRQRMEELQAENRLYTSETCSVRTCAVAEAVAEAACRSGRTFPGSIE